LEPLSGMPLPIRRAKATAIRSRKSSLRSGTGRNIIPGQPENERYLNYVADKFESASRTSIHSRVTSAVFDERADRWEVRLESGQRMSAQFLVAAVGILSARNIPPFEGGDSFKGESFHTSRWPKEKVRFHRQACRGHWHRRHRRPDHPDVRKEVGHLHRLPTYCRITPRPLRNSLVSDETQRRFKASLPGHIPQKVQRNYRGFLHDFEPARGPGSSRARNGARCTSNCGRCLVREMAGNFRDIMTDRVANEDFRRVRTPRKIRARVKDPVVAEKLVPKDHPFGSKRVPLETEYYEAYNRTEWFCWSYQRDPNRTHHPQGIKTSDRRNEFDVHHLCHRLRRDNRIR